MKNKDTWTVGISENKNVVTIPKKIVGFTCGAFDLLTPGHMLMFEEAKAQCDFLIVAVQEDPSRDRKDKNKPVLSVQERVMLLKGIRFIDEVVTYDLECTLIALLKNLKPDVRILGADWKGKEFTGKGIEGIKIHFNKRYGDWSSTNIRERVVEAEKEKERKEKEDFTEGLIKFKEKK